VSDSIMAVVPEGVSATLEIKKGGQVKKEKGEGIVVAEA